MSHRLFTSFIVAVFFAVLYPTIIYAQTPGISLSVYPSSFDFRAKPGDIIKDKFRIRNDQTDPQDLTVSVQKLITDTDTGQPVPADLTAEDTYGSWVTFENPNFTALPREWIDVNFTISVPDDASFGYYYVFEIKPQKEIRPQGTGAVVTGHISIAALLNVENGTPNMKARIVEFKATNYINEYLPVTFWTKIANEGNIHLRPKGSIFIHGLNQADDAIIDVNAIKGAVLPQGTRSFESSWTEGFLVREPITEDGKPKVDANGNQITKLTINWNKLTSFRFGKYTANVLMVYDTGTRDETIEATTTFWVIPWKALLILLISILVIIFSVRWMLKAYIRKELERKK